MFSTQYQELGDSRLIKVIIHEKEIPLAFSRVIQLWESDATFREFFTAMLADVPFAAFRWECPPVTKDILDQSFECVVSDSPLLDTTPDPSAFASQFEHTTTDSSIVSFRNLGKDAILVVPRPCSPAGTYGHLAAFVREAPEPQRHELWQRVAAAMRGRLGKRPVWLSTAGAGVPWLHVRLDDRPKYYRHRPYCQMG